MQDLIEFVMLRPVFTRRTIHLIWYGYLFATLAYLIHYAVLFGSAFQSNWAGSIYYLGLISPILYTLAHLALVRIFLEMALQFIEKRMLKA